MHLLTADELLRQPDCLLADARRGECAVVTDHGAPIFMTVPMGLGVDAGLVRLELAVRFFDAEQVSLSGAAAMAGLSISAMIDELGRRQIPVIRITPQELADELDYVRTLADRR